MKIQQIVEEYRRQGYIRPSRPADYVDKEIADEAELAQAMVAITRNCANCKWWDLSEPSISDEKFNVCTNDIILSYLTHYRDFSSAADFSCKHWEASE